jgi:hypothetical protein
MDGTQRAGRIPCVYIRRTLLTGKYRTRFLGLRHQSFTLPPAALALCRPVQSCGDVSHVAERHHRPQEGPRPCVYVYACPQPLSPPLPLLQFMHHSDVTTRSHKPCQGRRTLFGFTLFFLRVPARVGITRTRLPWTQYGTCRIGHLQDMKRNSDNKKRTVPALEKNHSWLRAARTADCAAAVDRRTPLALRQSNSHHDAAVASGTSAL